MDARAAAGKKWHALHDVWDLVNRRARRGRFKITVVSMQGERQPSPRLVEEVEALEKSVDDLRRQMDDVLRCRIIQ